jgi:8-oxo-dGTP pyrophosphatase MutT (NUDIX family)
MRWIVHGERQLYHSRWVELCMSDVELPDGTRFEHHLVRVQPSVGIVVYDAPSRRVLMVWRHRFTTETWNWELPGGWVDPGEQPQDAAAREAEEETGWRPRDLSRLSYLQPIAGIANAEQHVFLARGATHLGPPQDAFESDRVAWIPLARVPDMIARREIVGGVSVAGLMHVLFDLGATAVAPRSAA